MSAWRFVLLVFLSFSLLIVASTFIGHLLPLPANATALARNSCALPCFFGVTPGKTTRAEALNTLKAIHAVEDNTALISFTLVDEEGRTSLATINFGADGLVDSVRLIPIDQFASAGVLGDLLATGQRPMHVFHTCDYLLPVRFLITFGAHDELVTEVFPEGNLAPDSRITLFDLSTAASRSLYDATSSFGCTVRTDWHGLTPLWKYFAVDKPPV